MKLNRPTNRRGQRGVSILECMVYIAVLTVVAGFAYQLFFSTWDDEKALRHDADDIVRVLHAGDRWRADIRIATGAMQLTTNADGEALTIPTAHGDVIYAFSRGQFTRQSPGDSDGRVYISRVKSSHMREEQRGSIATWTLDLELQTAKRTAWIRPLFSFEAVAGHLHQP